MVWESSVVTYTCLPTPGPHATRCRFAFENRVALRTRVMLHVREGDIESRFDQNLITH